MLTGKKDANGNYTGLEGRNQTRFSKRPKPTNGLGRSSGRVNDNLTLTPDLQYIKSSTRTSDSTVGTGVQLPKQTVDLTGSMPKLVFDQGDMAIMNDPSKYYWAMMMDHLDKSKGTQKAWKGDARWTFNDDSILQDPTFGVRLAKRDAETINSNPNYNWATITPRGRVGWNIGELAYLPKSDLPTFKNTYSGFMNGRCNSRLTCTSRLPPCAFGPDSYNKLHQLYLNECDKFSRPLAGTAQGCVQQANNIQGRCMGGRDLSVPTRPAGTRNPRAPLPPMGRWRSPGGPWPPARQQCRFARGRTQNDADGYTILRTQPALLGPPACRA